jgi:hypothetical protein
MDSQSGQPVNLEHRTELVMSRQGSSQQHRLLRAYVADLHWNGIRQAIQRVADPLHNRTRNERGWLFHIASQMMETWGTHVFSCYSHPVEYCRQREDFAEHELLELAAQCWLALLRDGQDEENCSYDLQGARVLWRPGPWILWNTAVSASLVSPVLLGSVASELWVAGWQILADLLTQGKPLPLPQTAEERRQRLEFIVAVAIRLLLSLQHVQLLTIVKQEFQFLQSSGLLVTPEDELLPGEMCPMPGILERLALAKALQMVKYLMAPPLNSAWPQIFEWIKLVESMMLQPAQNLEHADLLYLLKTSALLAFRMTCRCLRLGDLVN